MATGENGANGALVLRRVIRENNQEHVNVIHLLPNMPEKFVQAIDTKFAYAMTMCHVQVNRT